MSWWAGIRSHRSPAAGSAPTLRERARSIYESRFKREDPAGKELILSETGRPRMVVIKGQFAGYRAKDGSIIKPPERRIEEIPDTEWTWVGGEWRERWM